MSLQGNFCLYPLPDDRSAALPPKIIQTLPPSGTVECVVRVYVIRAFDLQPHDPGGSVRPRCVGLTSYLRDPYLWGFVYQDDVFGGTLNLTQSINQ